MSEGKRYNEGKLRYDLLEPYAIEELAKVFTKGAQKYEPHNWLKGMQWSSMRASLARHLAAYDKGEDYDFDPKCENCQKGSCTNHSGLLHMAHVAWNAMALVSYYKHFPQGDDRMTGFFKNKRIGIDIDEVLADFLGAFSKKLGLKKPSFWSFDFDFEKNYGALKDDKDFWLNMEMIVKPEDLHFEPVVYITARPEEVIPFTREWLIRNGYPAAPVISSQDKLSTCKEHGINVFIDDKFETFQSLNSNGILCYLFDALHNQKRNVGFKRINKDTIKDIV